MDAMPIISNRKAILSPPGLILQEGRAAGDRSATVRKSSSFFTPQELNAAGGGAARLAE